MLLFDDRWVSKLNASDRFLHYSSQSEIVTPSGPWWSVVSLVPIPNYPSLFYLQVQAVAGVVHSLIVSKWWFGHNLAQITAMVPEVNTVVIRI